MDKESVTESSGAFILIAAVVVLFVIGALLVTKIVLKSNHDNMVQDSERIQKQINEFEMQQLKAKSVHHGMTERGEKT